MLSVNIIAKESFHGFHSLLAVYSSVHCVHESATRLSRTLKLIGLSMVRCPPRLGEEKLVRSLDSLISSDLHP